MNTSDLEDTADLPVPVFRLTTDTPPSRSSSARVEVSGLSHQGRVRPNNEDNFLIVRAGRFLETVLSSLPEGELPDEIGETVHGMAVADGLGGMAAGEVASRIALTSFVNLVLHTPDWILSLDEPALSRVVDRMIERFRTINAEVLRQARRDPSLTGMGTTLTLALSLGADLFIAHLGDSRVFLLRRGRLRALTDTHTLAQEMADMGLIPAEDVSTHRLRHVLTHCIGCDGEGWDPQVRRFRLRHGDRLLLCTDGLTDMVGTEVIQAELERSASAESACQTLVDRALEGGGRDNVTVVVAFYDIDEDRPEPEPAGTP